MKIGSFCVVRNLSVIGSPEKINLPKSVGSRHGILFAGDAEETKNYENQPKHSIIDACFISSFSGGGISCSDTGYSIRSAITASNCHIFNCGFDCNETGFLIDNSRKQSNNQAHGSAIGCTFNHSGNNSGIGIQILGANWGYVFDGYQLFYSKIVLENSTDISFSSLNFGGKKAVEIDISGGNLTAFSNCAFLSKPIITVKDNDKVKFINCFTKDGEPVSV